MHSVQGDYDYLDFRAEKLFTDEVTPILTPEFPVCFDCIESFSDISDAQLIHIDWGENFASQPTWADWFQKAGVVRNPEVRKGMKVATSSMAIAMAGKGLGVALGQMHLARAEIESGVVVTPFSQSLKLAQSYYAIMPHTKSANSSLKRLIDCLTCANR